jgi:outer membrane protein OmpA-like peptidoglycan-associated protein
MHRFICTFCFLFVLNLLFAQNKTPFVIEVAAFAESAPNGYFKEVAGIYETLDVNYIYRYYIDVPDLETAKIKKKEIKAAGFINARIIDFIALRKGCDALCQYNPPIKTGTFAPSSASYSNEPSNSPSTSNASNSISSSNPTNSTNDSRTTSSTDSTNSTNASKTTRNTKASNSNKNSGLASNKNSKERKFSSSHSKRDLNQNIQFIYPSSSSSDSPENFHCIFFDFDESYIRDDAKIELDRLVILMQKNTTHQVEILAHTDARGTQKYNNALSMRRAVETQDYLTKHGIKRTKIIKNPLGESSPIALNELATGEDTIVGRQLNRRVEFKILDKSGNVLNVVDKIRVPKQIQK